MSVIVYLAGPYRSSCNGNRRENIRIAEAWAAQLWSAGYTVLSPHLNTAFLDEDAPAEAFIDGDLDMIRALARGADGFVLALLPGWQFSAGTLGEKVLANELGVPVVLAEELLAGKETPCHT